MRDEGDMLVPPAPQGCLEICTIVGVAMILFYVLLTAALVLLAV